MREPIPTWFFVLAVVRQDPRFLVVRERKHDQTWYLPAGRVEPNESLQAAVTRETREESRVEIEPEGILQFQHTPIPGAGCRVRVVFLARPRPDSPAPGATADSLDAAWVTLEELRALPLRGEEVLHWVQLADQPAPLRLLGSEWPA